MTDTKNNRPPFDAGLGAEAAARTERAYLAAALEAPVRVIPEAVRRGMTGADFTGKARGDAFDAILAAFRDGGAVDSVTVFERLAAAGNAAAVAEIEKCDGQGFPAHAGQYAAEIVKRSQYRRIAALGMELAADAGGREEDPAALLSRAAGEVAAMQNAGRGERTCAEIVAEIVENGIARAEGCLRVRGVLPPTPETTRLLGPLEPGLHEVAAQTSAGKSTFEGQTSRSVALGGGRVARCLLDMPANELLSRDLAALCFVGVKRIKEGPLFPDEKHALRLAAAAWRDFGMETMAAPTMGEIVARAQALHADKGLDLLTVDYAQVVRTGNARLDGSGNTNAQLESIVAELKNFAIREGVPVLLISQLNRANRDEMNPPVLSDLRGSGGLEQAARTASFLYPDAAAAGVWSQCVNPAAWRDLPLRPIRFKVAKSQQGPTGEACLRMFCPFFTIEDADKDPVGNPDWNTPGKTGPNNPLPVIARDGDGRLAAFDARFLDRVNAAARAQGFPVYNVVETVAGGVAAVADRLREWREDARRAGT